MNGDIVLVAPVRTAIGRYQGGFQARPPGTRCGGDCRLAGTGECRAADVDEVIMGCVGQVGDDAFNARLVRPESRLAGDQPRL